MADDSFDFNFPASEARRAVAEVGRRLSLAHSFGYPDSWRVAKDYAPGEMINAGYWYDQVTEHWFPHWWPEWAK